VQKKFIYSYLCIFFALLFVMSLSSPATQKIRGTFVAFLAPIWEQLMEAKRQFSFPMASRKDKTPEIASHSTEEELLRLQLENQLLANELNHLHSLFNQQPTFFDSLKDYDTDDYQKYVKRLKQQASIKTLALPARVIFRSSDSWNSSIWVNVGEANNLPDLTIVAKNSPVLVGNSIVGVIDYVGKHQARVRLITDSGLTPSVRAARGGEQECLICEHVNFLMQALSRKKDFLIPEMDQEEVLQILSSLQQYLQPFKKSWYLAKGELRGKSDPVWRGHSQILQGTGFNFDFSDEEGEARDLRTGKLLNNPNSAPLPILKVHDVLITTGMDGVFPSGFRIAFITKVSLLKEGDYFYELEAKPTAGNLNELSHVFVLPPLGYDKGDQPSHR
jgi:rod shape-determining protein MreC